MADFEKGLPPESEIPPLPGRVSSPDPACAQPVLRPHVRKVDYQNNWRCATQKGFLQVWQHEQPFKSNEDLNGFFAGGASLTSSVMLYA